MKHQARGRVRAAWLAPVGLLTVALGIWLVPAGVVTLASPATPSPTPSSTAWPELFAMPQDSPRPEENAQTGELGTASPGAVPSDATSADGQASPKQLGDVLDGSTVLRSGDKGLPVRFVQQRLNMIGIATPESGIYDDATTTSITHVQEKFSLNQSGRVNRYTLTTLLQASARGPALPDECRTGTVICVDKTQKIVRLVVDGTPTITLDARFGAFGNATNEGTFTVYDKIADDWSQAFDVPMKYSMYFSDGQAVHYSDFFAHEGYTGASHGCVNTRDLDATAAMFDQVEVGTPVVIYR